jgi:nascent polypeptide-associated complex subunit alpha
MIPGMNPRQMQQAMKKMGMKQIDVDAEEVIIRCADKNIVISNPQVAKVIMMGQETWQISGSAREEAHDTSVDITAEDIATVMEQASVSEDVAKEAIEKANGDLAEAILSLSEE